MCACSWAAVYSGVCAGVRGQLAELVLSFHQVDPGGETEFITLGGKHVYSLSHLSGPNGLFETMRIVWSIVNSPRRSCLTLNIYLLVTHCTYCHVLVKLWNSAVLLPTGLAHEVLDGSCCDFLTHKWGCNHNWHPQTRREQLSWTLPPTLWAF